MASTSVVAQLRFLVQNINKKNQKASVSEIAHILWLNGESSFVVLLCCLLEEIDFRDQKLQKDQLKAQLLAQEFAKLAALPNFVSLFCEVISFASLPAPLQEDFLHAVARAVKATIAQQLAMGLGLAQCGDTTLRAEGTKFLRTRLNDVTSQPSGRDSVSALPEDLGHALVFFLERQEGFAKQRAALMKQLQHLYPADRVPLSLLPLMHPVDVESTELNSRLAVEAEHTPIARPRKPPSNSGLADLMQDLGYSCCANATCFGEVLAQFGALDAPAVGAMIGMMARSACALDDSLSLHTAFSAALCGKYLEFDAKFDADKEDAVKALSGWNVEAFVEAVSETSPSLAWAVVFEHLDEGDLHISSTAGITLIVAIHRLVLGVKLPVTVFVAPMRSAARQLRSIRYLLAARSDADVDWEAGTEVGAQIPVGLVRPELMPWNCLELTGTLLRISACGLYGPVRDLVDEAARGCPRLLIAALLQTASVDSAFETQLQAELLEHLLPLLISSDAHVLKHMWELQPAMVMRGMVQLHNAQPQSLLRLLDLAQSFNALDDILRIRRYSFTLDLAVVAQRKDLVSLDAWAAESLRAEDVAGTGHEFAMSVLAYIREKLLGGGGGAGRVGIAIGSGTVNALSVEHAATLFRELTSSPLPPHIRHDVGALYTLCATAKPKLQALFNPDTPASLTPGNPEPSACGQTGSQANDPVSGGATASATAALLTPRTEPPSSLASSDGVAFASVASLGAFGSGPPPLPGMPGGQEIHFAAGIEEEANSYFQRIYTGASSIDEVIALLKRFQASGSLREQQVRALFQALQALAYLWRG